MKRVKLIPVLGLLAGIIFQIQVSAQDLWESMQGPLEKVEFIKAIYSDGTYFYVGSWDHGMFRSKDNGQSWSSINTTGNNSDNQRNVRLFFETDMYLFAGLENYGVFRSSDKGETWQRLNSKMANNAGTTYGMVETDNYLFVANGGGLFRSGNKGDSWNKAEIAAGETGYGSAIGYHNDILYIATSTKKLYKSDDEGESWQEVTVQLDENANIYQIAFEGAKIVLGTSSGVYRSTDNGDTWQQLTSGLPEGILNISDLLLDGNTWYVSIFSRGLYKSNDGGDTWQREEGLDEDMKYINTVYKYNNVLYIGTRHYGILKNDGTGWMGFADGLINPVRDVFTVFTKDDYVFAGVEDRGIFRTAINEHDWERLDFGIPNSDGNKIRGFAAIGNDLFAATFSGIAGSSDNGETWSLLPNEIAFTDRKVNALAAVDGYLFAGTYQGTNAVYRSSNNGQTWNAVADGLPANANAQSFTVYDGTLFLALLDEGVFRSTDYGDSWEQVGSEIQELERITSLAMLGDTLLAAGMNGASRSADNGDTWVDITNSKPGYAGFRSLAVHGSVIYATGFVNGQGVFYSENGGDDWMEMNQGFTGNAHILWNIYADSNYLYAGTFEDGVWKYPLPEIASPVAAENVNRPAGFALEQNYPNPFNPSTNITFSLEKPGFVNLTVYNVSGRKVAELVSGVKSAGEHSVQWNAGSLASGIYYYKLSSAGRTVTRKMALIK